MRSFKWANNSRAEPVVLEWAGSSGRGCIAKDGSQTDAVQVRRHWQSCQLRQRWINVHQLGKLRGDAACRESRQHQPAWPAQDQGEDKNKEKNKNKNKNNDNDDDLF